MEYIEVKNPLTQPFTHFQRAIQVATSLDFVEGKIMNMSTF